MRASERASGCANSVRRSRLDHCDFVPSSLLSWDQLELAASDCAESSERAPKRATHYATIWTLPPADFFVDERARARAEFTYLYLCSLSLFSLRASRLRRAHFFVSDSTLKGLPTERASARKRQSVRADARNRPIRSDPIGPDPSERSLACVRPNAYASALCARHN